MRRLTLLAIPLALALGAARPAGAQIISVPKGGLSHGPYAFATAGVGLFALQGVLDGQTQTYWNFSQTIDYAGSLEFALGRGSSLGVSASYANVPLTYQQIVNTPGGSGVLNTDAHVNVYIFGAQFAVGPGSAGFHQVIVANAGVIAFENFHADAGGGRLAPQRDLDPRLAIGYGIGYGFKSGEAFLLQEYGVALHQSTGLSGSDRRQYQQQTTRLGFRVGIGR